MGQTAPVYACHLEGHLDQGGSGTWIPNQGQGGQGGVRPKAEKKVTPTNLMVELVSDPPVAIVATSLRCVHVLVRMPTL